MQDRPLDPEGNVYVMVANGTFDTVLNSQGFPSRGDFGNSFLKISTSGGRLSVTDYFTMFNVAEGKCRRRRSGFRRTRWFCRI